MDFATNFNTASVEDIAWKLTYADIQKGIDMPNGSFEHFLKIRSEVAKLKAGETSSRKRGERGQDKRVEVVLSEALTPAVPVEDSIQYNAIICLEDGTEHVMLARYLGRRYGLTPDEYRKRWGLPKDYPMAAPSYSATKSAQARQHGLGTHEARKRHNGLQAESNQPENIQGALMHNSPLMG